MFMTSDVIDLETFYETRLGQVARRMISRGIRQMWPDVTGQRVLALGYGAPYLRQFRDEAERVFAIMPATQGVSRWPKGGPSLVALAEDIELPLVDNAVDRVLVAHGLEFSEHLRPMLREIWRVLTDGGRLLVVVPNRRGIWARLERTPFGHGRPYSPPQLAHLLRESMFQPTLASTALYMPPSRSRMALGAAAAWERIGERWGLPFAGVALVEAGKQIYAAGGWLEMAQARKRYVTVPAAARPVPGLRPKVVNRARRGCGSA